MSKRPTKSLPKSSALLPLLDLHGFKTADVPAAVDRFLVQSMRRGSKRVRIMTGKGTGQVKKTVTDYLRLGGYPFEAERLANGARNDGVLIVFLDD
jgi:DNA-nicking Smr family endonuclease